jgi:hypothetical protein
MSATLNKLRRLQQRHGRPGRCPLEPPPWETRIVKILDVVDGQRRPAEDDPDLPPCELCGEHHGVVMVLEVVIVEPDQARGTP